MSKRRRRVSTKQHCTIFLLDLAWYSCSLLSLFTILLFLINFIIFLLRPLLLAAFFNQTLRSQHTLRLPFHHKFISFFIIWWTNFNYTRPSFLFTLSCRFSLNFLLVWRASDLLQKGEYGFLFTVLHMMRALGEQEILLNFKSYSTRFYAFHFFLDPRHFSLLWICCSIITNRPSTGLSTVVAAAAGGLFRLWLLWMSTTTTTSSKPNSSAGRFILCASLSCSNDYRSASGLHSVTSSSSRSDSFHPSYILHTHAFPFFFLCFFNIFFSANAEPLSLSLLFSDESNKSLVQFWSKQIVVSLFRFLIGHNFFKFFVHRVRRRRPCESFWETNFFLLFNLKIYPNRDGKPKCERALLSQLIIELDFSLVRKASLPLLKWSTSMFRGRMLTEKTNGFESRSARKIVFVWICFVSTSGLKH